MTKDILQKKLYTIWNYLYPGKDTSNLKTFIDEIDTFKAKQPFSVAEEQWYKDAIVYSLYVDLFANNFNGLEEKLPYLRDLGVTCLWLLPILESPMKDDASTSAVTTWSEQNFWDYPKMPMTQHVRNGFAGF